MYRHFTIIALTGMLSTTVLAVPTFGVQGEVVVNDTSYLNKSQARLTGTVMVYSSKESDPAKASYGRGYFVYLYSEAKNSWLPVPSITDWYGRFDFEGLVNGERFLVRIVNDSSQMDKANHSNLFKQITDGMGITSDQQAPGHDSILWQGWIYTPPGSTLNLKPIYIDQEVVHFMNSTK